MEGVIANRVTNVRLHSLSQIFKGGTEVRVDIPAPHHNVISEKTKQIKTNNAIIDLLCPD